MQKLQPATGIDKAKRASRLFVFSEGGVNFAGGLPLLRASYPLRMSWRKESLLLQTAVKSLNLNTKKMQTAAIGK